MQDALVAEARSLDEDARYHKREAARHRRAAKEARARQAQLEAECRRRGITVTYTNGEGDTHGRSRTAPRN